MSCKAIANIAVKSSKWVVKTAVKDPSQPVIALSHRTISTCPDLKRTNDIIVVGAGCIGQGLAASLLNSNKNNRVFLAARNLRQSNEISKVGIKIKGVVDAHFLPSERLFVSSGLPCELPTMRLSPNPIIFLATKASSAAASIDPFKELFSTFSPSIICLQNGLGTRSEIQKTLDGIDVKILKGHVFGAVHRKDDSMFAYKGKIMVEKSDDRISKLLRLIFENQEKSIFDVEISPNILQSIYPKLAVNCVCNPLTIILNENLGAIRTRHETLIRGICNEIFTVSLAENLNLQSQAHLAEFVLGMMSKYSGHYSSMHLDHVAGRKTEIDYINGAILRIAAKKGIDVPLNSTMTAAIKEIEKRRESCTSASEFYLKNSSYLVGVKAQLDSLLPVEREPLK